MIAHGAGEGKRKSQEPELEEAANVNRVWGKQDTGSAWMQAVTEV